MVRRGSLADLEAVRKRWKRELDILYDYILDYDTQVQNEPNLGKLENIKHSFEEKKRLYERGFGIRYKRR